VLQGVVLATANELEYELVLEENPKWTLLAEVLQEIEGINVPSKESSLLFYSHHSCYSYSYSYCYCYSDCYCYSYCYCYCYSYSYCFVTATTTFTGAAGDPGRVLILTRDERTCHQLQDVRFFLLQSYHVNTV
jgi:hypothetical protein